MAVFLHKILRVDCSETLKVLVIKHIKTQLKCNDIFQIVSYFRFNSPLLNENCSSTNSMIIKFKFSFRPPNTKKRVMRDSTVVRRQGNIHRLTDRDSSDDEGNTWNGNSTQQM